MITIVSYVITAVYSFYVPVVIVPDDTNLSMAADREQIYTREQLEEAERKMDERIRLRKEEDRKKTLKNCYKREETCDLRQLDPLDFGAVFLKDKSLAVGFGASIDTGYFSADRFVFAY